MIVWDSREAEERNGRQFDTGEPLAEMCPPMSIVELEAEMERPS